VEECTACRDCAVRSCDRHSATGVLASSGTGMILRAVLAHTMAITQPIKVQPKNKFNTKMALVFLVPCFNATIEGRKYSQPKPITSAIPNTKFITGSTGFFVVISASLLSTGHLRSSVLGDVDGPATSGRGSGCALKISHFILEEADLRL